MKSCRFVGFVLPLLLLTVFNPLSIGLKMTWFPEKINTLVLRVDFGYEFKPHPELIAENALSKKDVKKLVKACRDGEINIIPQLNLLEHQSWSTKKNTLMEKYPQFNETPYVPIEQKMEWPNEYGYYCLSYCPLHPDVHHVVFDVMDEIVEVFEAKAFHAGMDEVFISVMINVHVARAETKQNFLPVRFTAIEMVSALRM